MHSIQTKSSELLLDMSKKHFATDNDVAISSNEESQNSINRESQSCNSNLDSDSCSDDTIGSVSVMCMRQITHG